MFSSPLWSLVRAVVVWVDLVVDDYLVFPPCVQVHPAQAVQPSSTPSAKQTCCSTRRTTRLRPHIWSSLSGLNQLPLVLISLSSLIFDNCSTPELEEDGIRIALTVVDTPGFGDNIDNEDGCVPSVSVLLSLQLYSCSCIPRFQEIMTYLKRQYDDILAEQSRIKRNPRFRDNRVHALLYFIPPTGHA